MATVNFLVHSLVIHVGQRLLILKYNKTFFIQSNPKTSVQYFLEEEVCIFSELHLDI